MSIVSAYVQSKEGNWYQDPVVRGPGWFICWDDDEPIELVIADGMISGAQLQPQTVLNQLHKQGWKLTIEYRGCEASRLFDGKFLDARAWFLKQSRNGPLDKMLAGNKRVEPARIRNEMPQEQGVFYFNGPAGHKGG
jgi:hypothetical protein